MSGFVRVGGSGLNEVKVHESVLIVVDPSHAGAHGLEVVLLVALGRVLHERDAGLFANIGEVPGGTAWLSFRGLLRIGLFRG